MDVNKWIKQLFLIAACGVLDVYSVIWKEWENCRDASGKPLPCVPQAINVARLRHVDASNTCGSPKAGYCELGPQKTCFFCDSNSTQNRHPAEFMVDKETNPFYDTTWWQSQNWYETNQFGLSDRNHPLKVNITLSFNKTYLISGKIAIRFYSERPQAMIIDKSADYGKTWQTMQYFARNCKQKYDMSNHDLGLTSSGDPYQLTCTESYSRKFPKRFGQVIYNERYNLANFLTPQTQSHVLATDVRIRLEYPATDGMEMLGTEEALNKYYFAISDISVVARCSCHGHSKFCIGPTMAQSCDCQHNTMGTDCDKCHPLFNNRPWMPANRTHANECQECDCNNHGTSCVYNATLGHGECLGCKDKTEGIHCQKCKDHFYRDLLKPVSDPGACIACDCYPLGTVDGSKVNCIKAATATEQIGQCNCKANVYGRRCDQCRPAHWGFTSPPQGECKPCSCNIAGTKNSSKDCHMDTGQCFCNPAVEGQLCDQCKDGYYSFPSCHRCQCDLGGAIPFCNKSTGACTCRHGVEGPLCKETLPNRFYPALDFLLFEAENAKGNFILVSPQQDNKTTYTGLGFAQLYPGDDLRFKDISVPMKHAYHIVIRYRGGCEEAQLVVTIAQENNNAIEMFQLNNSFNLSGEAYILGKQYLDSVVLNVTIKYNKTNSLGSNCLPQLIDSLVLIPDVNDTRVFRESNRTIQETLQNCVKSRISLLLTQAESPQCEALVFSASTEIYNGTKSCDCNRGGSNNPSRCETYGGQCSCKQGVGGRRCTYCLAGYHNFSSSGCKSCSCSTDGAVSRLCGATTGQCQCKQQVKGTRCETCKSGTFNIYSISPKGCQHCFGYGHAIDCTSADGFVAANISTHFSQNTSATKDGWTTVNASDNPVESAASLTDGMVVTALYSPRMIYISAPDKFLGNQIKSYGQKLSIKVVLRNTGVSELAAASGDVILQNNNRVVELKLSPSPSPNTTEYHVLMDETSLANSSSVTPFEFQSVIANLTALKIRAVFYPYPKGSAVFKSIIMDTAVEDIDATRSDMISFVENATCHTNYTGLSCEMCAPGYTREVMGSGPFGNCVLCSCNNRSRGCDPDNGNCTNCQLGTYGDRCEKCTNNVQGPDCLRCLPGFWGLSKHGCKPCECNLRRTSFGNSTCEWKTGQCMCNTTLHLGGRTCDRCKENAWNKSSSPLTCKECPHCYGDIESEVSVLRHQISSLVVVVETLAQHPLMNQQNPFYRRLADTVAAARVMMEKLNSSLIREQEAGAKCQLLTQALVHLEERLTTTAADRVTLVQSLSTSVGVNHRNITESIMQVKQLLQVSYYILNVTVQQGVYELSVNLNHLKERQLELQNLTFNATREQNYTLRANETINRLTEYAILTATQAADKARASLQRLNDLELVLDVLYSNSTRVRAYGAETVLIVTERLVNATKILNESKNLLEIAKTLHPNKIKDLNQLLARAAAVVRLSSQLTNQSVGLFMSSLPYINQINAAILRAENLEPSVIDAERNGSALHTDMKKEWRIAMDAIDKANQIHRAAKEILNILENFTTVVRDEQAQTVQLQSHIPVITAAARVIINNVTVMEPTMKRAAGHATEAFTMLNRAREHLVKEKQALSESHRLGVKVKNETKAAHSFINNRTVRNYIMEHIAPTQQLCRNFTETAIHSFSDARKLHELAKHLNHTAAQLSTSAGEIVEDSSSLPNVTTDNLPQIKTDLEDAAQKFNSLNLALQIATLRQEIQIQRKHTQTYKEKITEYKRKIDKSRKLLVSLNALLKC